MTVFEAIIQLSVEIIASFCLFRKMDGTVRRGGGERGMIVTRVERFKLFRGQGIYLPCNDSYERCVDDRAAGARWSEAVVERPVQLGQPVPLEPEPPARPGAVAEAASRSEVAGWPSCCSEGAVRRPDLTLIRTLNSDLLGLSRGKRKA